MTPREHFGNPMIEQRKLLLGDAFVILEPKAIFEITGEDRLKWLHSLLSQNIINLAPGDRAEALLLDANGRIEQIIHVYVDADSAWLSVSRDRGAALLEWLNKMVFRSRVSIAERSDEFVPVVSFRQSLEANGVETRLAWRDPWPVVQPGGVRYASSQPQFVSWVYFENLVPSEAMADLEAKWQTEGKLAGSMALDALRVAHWRPSEAELDDRSLPHELDLLATSVHLSKGCYRGQETVAKVHNLGHPPRRLVFLHLDGSGHEIPAVGASVTVSSGGEAKQVGQITSVAQHFESGPIALAVVSRSTPVDAEFLIVDDNGSQIAATQEVIVPPTAGKAANLPSRRNLMGGHA
jgi:folate-binding protein YgfZ